MSTNSKVDTYVMVQSWDEIVCSIKSEQATAIHNDMDDSHSHMMEQKK